MVSPKNSLTQFAIQLAEHERVSDRIIRTGMRRLLRNRLNEITSASREESGQYRRQFMERDVFGEILHGNVQL